ncbi:MAG: response regulator [Elusimicrobiota bacterium]
MIAQILVADDNKDIREMLRDFLESQHHRVLEATDGAQAFAIAEQEMPHLIIMDIVMPGVYGSTATRKIHEYWRTTEIPIIIISGSADQAVLGDLLKDPNIRYMKKPINLKELEKNIREMLPKGGYTP